MTLDLDALSGPATSATQGNLLERAMAAMAGGEATPTP